MEKIGAQINSYWSQLFENDYFHTLLIIGAVGYGSIYAPKLPERAAKFIQSPIVKWLFLAFIGYIFTKNAKTSLISALLLVLGVMALNYASGAIGEDSWLGGIEQGAHKALTGLEQLPHDLLYGSNPMDKMDKMDKKKVRFSEQDKDSSYEVIGPHREQEDTVPMMDFGGYDETGFAEKQLN